MIPGFQLPEEPLHRRLRTTLRLRRAADPELRRRHRRPPVLGRLFEGRTWLFFTAFILVRWTYGLLRHPDLTVDGRVAALALVQLFLCGFLSLSFANVLSPDSVIEVFAHWPAAEDWVLGRQRVLLQRRVAWMALGAVAGFAAVNWAVSPTSGPWLLGLLTVLLQYVLLACLGLALVARGGVWVVLAAVLAGVAYWVGSMFGRPFTGPLVDWVNRSGGFLGHLLPTAWLIQPWIALREGEHPVWWRWLPALMAPWVAFKSWQDLRHRYAFRERVLLDAYGEPPAEAGEEEAAAIEEVRSLPAQPPRSEIEERIRSRAFLAEELRPMTGWLERFVWGRLTSRERLLLEWRDAGLPDWTRRWWSSWAWLTCVFLAGGWLGREGNQALQAVVWIGGFLVVGLRFLPLCATLPAFPPGLAPVLPREEWRLRFRVGFLRALCGLPQSLAFALAVGAMESELGIARTTATTFGWVLLSSQMPGLHWVNAAEGLRSGNVPIRNLATALVVLAGFGTFALCVVACGFTPWTWLPLPVATGILVSTLLQRWMLRRLGKNRCDLEI